MANTVQPRAASLQSQTSSELTWIQRLMLKRFHPRAIFIDSVGLIWCGYYLWAHDLSMVLGAAVAFRILSYYSVMDMSPQRISETTLGKIALLHLNPANLIIQIAGTVVLIYGLWQHSTESILVGISVILLGHVFGWATVNPAFDSED